MHRLLSTIACAAGGIASCASAQPVGTATYSFHFGSPTGPSTIAPSPGQTFSVFVSVAFDPGIGAIISYGGNTGPVLGLSYGSFSIEASGSGTGSWSGLALDPPYNFPLSTSVGTPSGLNVSAAAWWMANLTPPHPSPNNPDVVWSGIITWNGGGATALNFTNLGETGILFDEPIWTIAPYESTGLPAMIIPAPGVAALLAFGGFIAARPRR